MKGVSNSKMARLIKGLSWLRALSRHCKPFVFKLGCILWMCSLESSVHYFEFLEKAFEGKIVTDLLVSIVD